MARRTSTDTSTTVEQEQDQQVEEQEQVEQDQSEPEVSATEVAPETPEEDKPVKDGEADLTEFQSAAQTAVEQRDTGSGDLPEGALEPVLKQYRELPSVKDRNRAKNLLKDLMKSAMEQMDLGLAKAYLVMQDSMTTATAKTPAERKPADPTALWRHNLATATIAYGELFSNAPEGIDAQEVVGAAQSAEILEAVAKYRTWLDTETPEGEERPAAPEVPAEVVAAFRLVRGQGRRTGNGSSSRIVSPHDGPRRDLGKHIEEAFANVEDGAFLSVADIRKFRSSEYGDEQPSAGAISARLFPSSGTCTIPGITPGTGGEKGTKGAFKGSPVKGEAEEAA